MRKGGVQRQISLRSLQVLRVAELLVAGSFLVYCTLATLGLTSVPPRLSTGYVSIVIAVFWLMITAAQYLLPTPPRQLSIAKHSLHLGFLILLTLSYTTFLAPTSYLIAVSLIAAYIYFGMRGLFGSLGILVIVAMVDAYITTAYIDSFIISAVIAVLGGVIAGTMRGRSFDQEEVASSKEQAIIQRDRTVTLINNLSDAVISTDADGFIMVHNAATRNLLDTNSDLDNKPLDEILKLTTSEGEDISLIEQLKTTSNVVKRDDLSLQVSGETLRVEVTYSPIRSAFNVLENKKQQGYVIIVRDITHSKSLDDERDEFISVVSHELRTPITIAEGTISNTLLMMDRDDVPKAKLTNAINLAYEQVVFLTRMVNDLSMLSRAERGVADTPELIDVDELIHDLYNEYLAEATEKGLVFDLHMPTRIGHVMASRLYLKELLQNFITNAIKYTKVGKVSISVNKSPAGVIQFSVKDTGIGVSKSDQKRIFDKFFRAEDYRTRETKGTGLGLYVAVKLAAKLNTEIKLQSRLNHGSIFSFELHEHKPADTKN